jgi:hypothetical protein
MRSKKTLIIVLSLLLVTLSLTPALAVQKYGAKAYGMGGAFTALADDASAIYWNPAGLVQSGLVGTQFSVGLKPDSDLMEGVQDVMDAEIATARLEAMNGLESGSVNLNGMVTGNFKSVGLGVIFDNNFDYNSDSQIATNKAIGEGALSFGMQLMEPPLNIGALSIGANLKGIYGQYDRADTDPTNDFSSTAKGYGLDVGALAKVTDMVNIGVNIRNMTSSLDWDEEDSALEDSLPRTISVGTALKLPYPLGATVALDIEKPEEGEDIYHVGLEKNLLFNALSLRAGMYEPISGDGDRVVTGGLGLNLAAFHLNAAMDSNDYVTVSANAKF